MSKLNLGPSILNDMTKEYIWKNNVARKHFEGFPEDFFNKAYNTLLPLLEKENLYVTPFLDFTFDGKQTFIDPTLDCLTIEQIKSSLSEGKDVVVYIPTLRENGLNFQAKVI